MTTEEFIKRAKKIHNNKYDYSKVEYKNRKTKVCIICPQHGEFWQTPDNHLEGKGCKYCSHQSFKHTKETFIEKARQIHGDKYDYSKVEYKNIRTKVCIICSKHGEFWQKPDGHLRGIGCTFCKESKLEIKMEKELIKNNIDFERQKKFDWLGLQSLDFYIPSKNIAIECQGKQHFGEGGWCESFEILKERDERKYKLCNEHGIKILYYSNLGIGYPYQVYEDIKEIINSFS